MTSGLSGYNGYSYQTLSFLYELLQEDSISGEIEKGDDFLIETKSKFICYQTKNCSSKVSKKETIEFLPNFLSYFKENENSQFEIISQFGLSNQNFEKLFEELIKKKKISLDDKYLIDRLIPLIKIKNITYSNLISDLQINISDLIKNKGINILTKDTLDIINKLVGELFVSKKKLTKNEVIDFVIKEGSKFLIGIPNDYFKNSSDLVIKYHEEGFKNDNKYIDKAVSTQTKFYYRKKTLSLTPSLQDSFLIFYSSVNHYIKTNNLDKLTLGEFKIIIIKKLNESNNLELETYIKASEEILLEMYNSIIGNCTFRPKNEFNSD